MSNKESPHLESFACIQVETIVYYRITQQITDRLTSLKMDNMHNTSTNLLTSQLKHCTEVVTLVKFPQAACNISHS